MDPRSILSNPSAYSLFRRFVGRNTARIVYVRDHLRFQGGERILDLGCGPGDILEFLPDVSYVGYDVDAKYVEKARRRFGKRGEFHCEGLREDLPVQAETFDAVIAHGVLHHLDDESAVNLFRIARRALKHGGRLVTFDGCYAPGQSMIARALLRLDRGRHVRDAAAYEALALREFDQVICFLRHDLLRLPYTHIIMECMA